MSLRHLTRPLAGVGFRYSQQSRILLPFTKTWPTFPRPPRPQACRQLPPSPHHYMASFVIPSAVQNIQDDLQHFKHDKWGWVIYRCTYGDDEAWERFQQIINERSQDNMAQAGVPQEVATTLEWTFVSDRAALDGVSREELRRRFRAWANEAEKLEQPRADRGPKLQRYLYFIQVDEDCLQSVVGANPSDPLDVGWVKIVQAEESTGNEDGEDEGWMLIAADMIGPDFYDAIGQMPESWYSFYMPPPALVVY